jgi:methionine-rich copper-binding protein CopC
VISIRGDRFWRRLATLLLLLLAAGVALAHADYESSAPDRDAVLEAPPAEVRVTFTEAVETRFSIFKVYPLELPPSADMIVADPDFLRLNGLAGLVVADVLQLRDDDEARADKGLVDPPARTNDVTLELRPDLTPGAYVVMWRVLAADTHPTQGYFVFVVAPADDGP